MYELRFSLFSVLRHSTNSSRRHLRHRIIVSQAYILLCIRHGAILLLRIGLQDIACWRRNRAARPDSTRILWLVTCKLLKAEPSGDFLIVEDLPILALLLDLHLPQLAILNLLVFTHSRIHLLLA